MEVMHGWRSIGPEWERLEGDVSMPGWFGCTCCFSASVPSVTLGQLLKVPVQGGPTELEDEDGAAKLSLFRACPESFRVKSGAFAYFIHSVCSLPWGVRPGSLLAQAQPVRQLGGGAHYCPLACCLPPGFSPCLRSTRV